MSTGRFHFLKYLQTAKVHFRQSKISYSIAKLHFLAIDNNIFAEHDHRLKIERCCRRSKTRFNQCVRYCRMPGVMRQRHPFFGF